MNHSDGSQGGEPPSAKPMPMPMSMMAAQYRDSLMPPPFSLRMCNEPVSDSSNLLTADNISRSTRVPSVSSPPIPYRLSHSLSVPIPEITISNHVGDQTALNPSQFENGALRINASQSVAHSGNLLCPPTAASLDSLLLSPLPGTPHSQSLSALNNGFNLSDSFYFYPDRRMDASPVLTFSSGIPLSPDVGNHEYLHIQDIDALVAGRPLPVSPMLSGRLDMHHPNMLLQRRSFDMALAAPLTLNLDGFQESVTGSLIQSPRQNSPSSLNAGGETFSSNSLLPSSNYSETRQNSGFLSPHQYIHPAPLLPSIQDYKRNLNSNPEFSPPESQIQYSQFAPSYSVPTAQYTDSSNPPVMHHSSVRGSPFVRAALGSRPRCPFPECQGISFDNVKGLQAHTRDHHRDGLGDSAIASGASVAGAVAAGGAKRDRDSRMRNSVLGVDGVVHYQQTRGGAEGASLSMQEERSGLLNPNGQLANYTELDGYYDSAGGGMASRGSRIVSVQVVPSQSLPHTSSIDESAQNQSQQFLQNRAYMQQQHNTTAIPNSANSTPDSTHMQSGQPARARSGGNILKPYVCTYPNCHKSFAQPAGLRSHTVTHTGDRHFVCKFENCDKRYTTNNRLKIHMRSHTNEKPYVCKHPGCTYAAKQACSLTQHKLTHLNPEEKRAEMEKRARTLPCAECGRVYRTMESLDLHSWKEHGKAGIVGIIVANNGGNGDGPGRQQNGGGSFEETDARFSEE